MLQLAAAANTHLLAAFASSLSTRFETPRDLCLVDDLSAQIRSLPLQASSVVTAKQDELDKLGTELWNLSTRLRREEVRPSGRTKEDAVHRDGALCLLRAFSFLLLDSAGGQGAIGRQLKISIRLMKVALKAARVCIDGAELTTATKVLASAAEYQEVLSKTSEGKIDEETELADRLRVEYFAVRIALVSIAHQFPVYCH